MKAGMRLVVSLLVALLASCVGCVQLPSVSLRVRARFERTESRSARALEARVDCGWSFERSARLAGLVAPEHELAPQAQPDPRAHEPSPCTVAAACAWERDSRTAALSAVSLESPIASGDVR
jgi:hypothetical protein